MNRLDCFNVAAALVLQRLLEHFPQPILLDTRALQDEIAAQQPDCAICGGPGNPGNLVGWTIRFLADEGYVRCGSTTGPAVPGCVLSAQGLAALQRRFTAIDPSPSIGARLLEAGRLLAPDTAGAIIQRLLSAL